MVFEVDNTTEQLICRLQESIQDTIASLESEQHEIKDLIDEVKTSCFGLAPATQVDLVSEDISKVRAAIQKLATAEQLAQHETTQGKILGTIEQESQAVSDIKAELPRVSSQLVQRRSEILTVQNENANRLEKLVSDLSASDTRHRLEHLQSLADKLDMLSGSLDAQMGKIFSEAKTVLNVAESNKATLDAVANYLSFPGYKRLFKGMEVSKDENTR